MNIKPVAAAGLLVLVLSLPAGALVRQAVFASWGLDFLQIASIGDVAVAGLSLLVRALPALVLTGAALWWAGRKRRGAAAVLVVLALGAVYGLVLRPAAAAARDGFYGPAAWLIDGGTGGCATARVLWTGQTAVVYSCASVGPRRFRVSFDRSSMTLVPAAQAGELVHRM